MPADRQRLDLARARGDDVTLFRARRGRKPAAACPSRSSPAPTPGIGKATAVALAREGHDSGSPGTRTRKARGHRARGRGAGRRAEVGGSTSPELPDAADVIDGLADELGGLDVLVNNSGTSAPGAVPRAHLGRLEAHARRRSERRVPLRAAAARRMVEQGRGGRIVNVTSVHEHVPLAGVGRLRDGEARPRRDDEADGARARRARHHRQLRRARRDRDADDRQRGRRPAHARRGPASRWAARRRQRGRALIALSAGRRRVHHRRVVRHRRRPAADGSGAQSPDCTPAPPSAGSRGSGSGCRSPRTCRVYDAGLMFWFTWKTFVGSYFALTSASRS